MNKATRLAAVVVITITTALALSAGACTATAGVVAPVRTGSFPARTYAPSASVEQLNAFLATMKADGGVSVLLPSGKVLWLFGDRLSDDGSYFIGRNAAAVQTGSTFTVLPGEFQPSTPDAWYWPGAAVVDGGRLVVLWSERVNDGSDFGRQGRTLAVSYDPVTLEATGQTAVAGAVGGSSAVRQGNWWRIYGTRAAAGFYGKTVVRWSVPVGRFGDLSKWTAATTVLPASWGAGTDVAVVTEGTHLRLYTKRFDIVGLDIITSSNESGQWSNPTIVKTVGSWTYAVHAHPEQRSPSITYAVNGPTAPRTGAYHLYAIGL